MNKLKFFFIVCFLVSTVALAKENLDLSGHGADLMKASYPMRYKFENSSHKSWMKSTYEERQEFLTNWYIEEKGNQKRSQIQARKENRDILQLEKERETEKKVLAKKIKDREKEKKQELKVARNEKESLDKMAKAQQRQLHKLQFKKLKH